MERVMLSCRRAVRVRAREKVVMHRQRERAEARELKMAGIVSMFYQPAVEQSCTTEQERQTDWVSGSVRYYNRHSKERDKVLYDQKQNS